eukprot:m.215538 g.215538  ORF g.215538 m.215538 type:complete len:91 (-) comp27930_c0_seq1:83-355(-)
MDHRTFVTLTFASGVQSSSAIRGLSNPMLCTVLSRYSAASTEFAKSATVSAVCAMAHAAHLCVWLSVLLRAGYVVHSGQRCACESASGCR